mgnify:FL=1
MDVNYIYILVICVLYMTICLLYGKYRCNHKNFKDPFQTKLGIWDLDGWSMLHVTEFVILGFLFPKYFLFIILLGIIWECMEFYVEYTKSDIFKGYGHCTTDEGNQVWWYGKISDLFCNLVGFGIGYSIRHYTNY